jgi:hypothetical protein
MLLSLLLVVFQATLQARHYLQPSNMLFRALLLRISIPPTPCILIVYQHSRYRPPTLLRRSA